MLVFLEKLDHLSLPNYSEHQRQSFQMHLVEGEELVWNGLASISSCRNRCITLLKQVRMTQFLLYLLYAHNEQSYIAHKKIPIPWKKNILVQLNQKYRRIHNVLFSFIHDSDIYCHYLYHHHLNSGWEEKDSGALRCFTREDKSTMQVRSHQGNLEVGWLNNIEPIYLDCFLLSGRQFYSGWWRARNFNKWLWCPY